MAVYLCKHCASLEPEDDTHNSENYLTFTEGDFVAEGVSCAHCGGTDLQCGHPSSQFDDTEQAFVCSWCGEINHDSASVTTLGNIDVSLPIDLYPYQHDLDKTLTSPVETLKPIILCGEDVALFLSWAKQDPWREQFERDLQAIANDAQGRKLLTTWIPLVTFRESFCSGGRQMQNTATQALMERLRLDTREWRAAGVDMVDVSGRARA